MRMIIETAPRPYVVDPMTVPHYYQTLLFYYETRSTPISLRVVGLETVSQTTVESLGADLPHEVIQARIHRSLAIWAVPFPKACAYLIAPSSTGRRLGVQAFNDSRPSSTLERMNDWEHVISYFQTLRTQNVSLPTYLSPTF